MKLFDWLKVGDVFRLIIFIFKKKSFGNKYKPFNKYKHKCGFKYGTNIYKENMYSEFINYIKTQY